MNERRTKRRRGLSTASGPALTCARHWAFLAVVAVGTCLRLVLIPAGHGQDFTVWDLASRQTLKGVNVYVHHPAYPGGPFAYLPFFIYVELPFQWLSGMTGTSFTIMGKLPIAAADLATAALLYRWTSRTRGPVVSACAAAFFWLNPLVLYNSAWYGRFDSVSCLFVLAFVMRAERREPVGKRTAVSFALAVAAKTYPLLLIFLARRVASSRWRQFALVGVATIAVICLPYLSHLVPLARDLAYDTGKFPGGLSWWTVLLLFCDGPSARTLSFVGLVILVPAAFVLNRRMVEVRTCAIATIIVFLLCSKVVLEQYLLWPLPLLIGQAADARHPLRWHARALIVVLTAAGMLDNESFHPWGRNCPLIGGVIVVACIVYLHRAWRHPGSSVGTDRGVSTVPQAEPAARVTAS